MYCQACVYVLTYSIGHAKSDIIACVCYIAFVFLIHAYVLKVYS